MRMFNATEVSELLNISKSIVSRLIKEGKLTISKSKKVKIMGKYCTVNYVNEEEVLNYMNSEEYKLQIEKKIKREENKQKKIFEKKEKREIEIQEFINLNSGITEELIGQVVYSYNKRAKHYRDIKDIEMKDEMYGKKEFLIKNYKPVEVHMSKRNVEYYDYPDGEYINYEDRWMYKANKEVVEVFNYYNIGGYGFHQPLDRIDDCNIKEFKSELNIKDIGDLQTFSVPFDELLDLDICEYIVKNIKVVA